VRVLKRIYEFFWRRTSGRPWTYEIRDWSDRYPGAALAIAVPVAAAFVIGQMMFVMWAGWLALPYMLFADFMAFVAGHLYWDTAGRHIRSKSEFRKG